jgi:ribose transport system substrate-binding protein
MRTAVGLVLLLGGAVVVAGGCRADPMVPPVEGKGAAPAGAVLKIAVIPKGTTHEFWKSIHAGAVKAERDLGGVRILWQGPVVEDDRTGQIKVVETFIADRVDGIVLAPLDDQALVRPVREAGQKGIPVVIIDSDLKDADAYASFVATDNSKGGELAGRRMAELLGPAGGKVAVLRYQVGSASTTHREQGFLDQVARHPAIRVVSDNQYAGPTVDSARLAADALLVRFGEGELDGLFCPNESSTYGMLEALRHRGRAGRIRFVGFDVSPKLIAALQAGDLQGLVFQDPFFMGEMGVRTVVACIRGQAVEKRIDTGVRLVTRENLAAPDVARLIHPPLKEYLD